MKGNLFAYCGNEPVGSVDGSGLAHERIHYVIDQDRAQETVDSNRAFGIGDRAVIAKGYIGINLSIENAVINDLISRGLSLEDMIPEFIGRLPVLTYCENLDENTLVKILTEPKNAICKEYQALLAENHHRLVFTQEALMAIASLAAARGTGARGLRSICEAVLQDVLFNAPDWEPSEITITKECVTDKAPPQIRKIT